MSEEAREVPLQKYDGRAQSSRPIQAGERPDAIPEAAITALRDAMRDSRWGARRQTTDWPSDGDYEAGLTAALPFLRAAGERCPRCHGTGKDPAGFGSPDPWVCMTCGGVGERSDAIPEEALSAAMRAFITGRIGLTVSRGPMRDALAAALPFLRAAQPEADERGACASSVQRAPQQAGVGTYHPGAEPAPTETWPLTMPEAGSGEAGTNYVCPNGHPVLATKTVLCDECPALTTYVPLARLIEEREARSPPEAGRAPEKDDLANLLNECKRSVGLSMRGRIDAALDRFWLERRQRAARPEVDRAPKSLREKIAGELRSIDECTSMDVASPQEYLDDADAILRIVHEHEAKDER